MSTPHVEPGEGRDCILHGEKLDQIDKKLDRIEAQTTATNGRVRALERWRLAIVAGIGGLLAGGPAGRAIVEALAPLFAGMAQLP